MSELIARIIGQRVLFTATYKFSQQGILVKLRTKKKKETNKRIIQHR